MVKIFVFIAVLCLKCNAIDSTVLFKSNNLFASTNDFVETHDIFDGTGLFESTEFLEKLTFNNIKANDRTGE